MELSQLKSGDKVKLKLEQPAIICSGRERINCHYRGVVSNETDKYIWISFKHYGVEEKVMFDKENLKCLHPHFKDLVIK